VTKFKGIRLREQWAYWRSLRKDTKYHGLTTDIDQYRRSVWQFMREYYFHWQALFILIGYFQFTKKSITELFHTKNDRLAADSYGRYWLCEDDFWNWISFWLRFLIAEVFISVPDGFDGDCACKCLGCPKFLDGGQCFVACFGQDL